MVFTVVLDHATPVVGRRAKRAASAVLGGLLLAIGIVAAVPCFVLTLGGLFYVIVTAMSQDDGAIPDDWTGPLWAAWAVSTVLTAVLLPVGVRLVRGERRLALFLRRFGHTEATDTMTFASAQIGSAWRLVTLDDAQVAPVGVGQASRGFLRLGRGAGGVWKAGEWFARRIAAPVLSLALAGAIGSLIVTVANGSLDEADGLTDWDQPAQSTATTVFRICVVLLGVGAALWLAWFALLLVWLVLTPVVGSFSFAADAIRSAERAKALSIQDGPAIATARGTIVATSKRFFSPKLFVITVNSAVWREAVTGFAQVSAVPLIDVSEPTEHIVWEIEQLTRRFGRHCVVVGQYDRLGRLFDQAAPGSVNHRVMQLLAGVEVLGYTTDVAGRKRFARALRAKRDTHGGHGRDGHGRDGHGARRARS
jgi:hypothetical protein